VDAFLTLVVLPVAEGRTATSTAQQEAALEVRARALCTAARRARMLRRMRRIGTACRAQRACGCAHAFNRV